MLRQPLDIAPGRGHYMECELRTNPARRNALIDPITNRQMVFVLILSLIPITIISLPKVIAQSAGVGGWIPLVILSVVFGVLASVFARLNRAFPGMTLYDYSRELVGKVGCIILSVFYGLYFLLVESYLCYGMATILKANFLFKTPHWAFLAASIPVFGYLAYHGPAALARVCELYGFTLIGLVATHTLMLFRGRVENILPLVIPSEIGRAIGAIDKIVVSFLGIEVLTVMPFSKKSKKAPRIAFFTLLAVGALYVLVVESSIMMVGLNEIQYHEFAFLTALRQLELKQVEFLRRIDILYLTLGLMRIFAGVSIAYLAAVEYLCRLIPRANRILIVAVTGALIFLLALMGSRVPNLGDLFRIVMTYVGIFSAVLIPVGLWVIAKVKKRA